MINLKQNKNNLFSCYSQFWPLLIMVLKDLIAAEILKYSATNGLVKNINKMESKMKFRLNVQMPY